MSETSTANQQGVSTGKVEAGPTELFQRAVGLHSQHDYHKAELLYRIVLSLDAENPEVYEYLGLLHLQKEELEKAQKVFQDAFQRRSGRKQMLEKGIVALQEALKHEPSASAYHCALGQAWRGIGYPQRGLELFEEAIRLDQDNSVAHNSKGEILFNHGQFAPALQSFINASRADSTNRQLLTNQGNAFSVLLQRRYGEELLPSDTRGAYTGRDEGDAFSSTVGSTCLYSPGGRFVYAPVYGVLDTAVNAVMYECEREKVPELPHVHSYLPDDSLRWLVNNVFALRRYSVALAQGVLSSREVFKFSIVINPFERLAAEYLKTFVLGRFDPHNKKKIDPVVHYTIDEDVLVCEEFVTFREFVEYVVAKHDNDLNHEWWPMFKTVHPGYLDFIARAESLRSDLEVVGERLGLAFEVDYSASADSGRTGKPGSAADRSPEELLAEPRLPTAAELYDSGLEKMVRQRYARDFELLGYETSKPSDCNHLVRSIALKTPEGVPSDEH